MVLENGVKNIQAAAYNGARTVVHKNTPLLEYMVVSSCCQTLIINSFPQIDI